MSSIQKHKPKGVPGAGQFDGIHHQYAEVRLGMEKVSGMDDRQPIDAGIAHGLFMANATSAYAHSRALSEDTRGVFAVQSKITAAYVADLEHLHRAGTAGPEDLLVLAGTYDANAAKAGKARGWTKKTRTDNATAAGEFRYLASTLRKLAAGNPAPAGPKV
jgi:hypothetical protein